MAPPNKRPPDPLPVRQFSQMLELDLGGKVCPGGGVDVAAAPPLLSFVLPIPSLLHRCLLRRWQGRWGRLFFFDRRLVQVASQIEPRSSSPVASAALAPPRLCCFLAAAALVRVARPRPRSLARASTQQPRGFGSTVLLLYGPRPLACRRPSTCCIVMLLPLGVGAVLLVPSSADLRLLLDWIRVHKLGGSLAGAAQGGGRFSASGARAGKESGICGKESGMREKFVYKIMEGKQQLQ